MIIEFHLSLFQLCNVTFIVVCTIVVIPFFHELVRVDGLGCPVCVFHACDQVRATTGNGGEEEEGCGRRGNNDDANDDDDDDDDDEWQTALHEHT